MGDATNGPEVVRRPGNRPQNKVDALERDVAELRQDIQSVLRVVHALKSDVSAGGGTAAPESEPRPDVDRIWECAKCHARLGVYDPASGEVRIRYRDLYVWVSRGDIAVCCRGGGEVNTLTYEPDQPG